MQSLGKFYFIPNQLLIFFLKYRCTAIVGCWTLGYMTKEEQHQILNWVLNDVSIALFIEPIGKGEFLDNNQLKANKKCYYDRLFEKIGLKTIKEGRFIWNEEEVFEHYNQTDSMTQTV